MMDCFRVIALNCNSLINRDRQSMLKNFIIENPACVYYLSETILKAARTIHMAGYNCFFQNNDFSRGGTHGAAKLNHFSDIFGAKNVPTIFGGDTNSRNTDFGDPANNVNGNVLIQCGDRCGIKIVNSSSPTWLRGDQFSFIDKFMFTPLFPFNHGNISLLPSFSDHHGISIALNTPGFNDVGIHYFKY